MLQEVFSLNSSAGAASTFISQSPPVNWPLAVVLPGCGRHDRDHQRPEFFKPCHGDVRPERSDFQEVVNGTGQITATSPPETPVLTSSQTVDVVVGSNFGLSVANDLDVFTSTCRRRRRQ